MPGEEARSTRTTRLATPRGLNGLASYTEHSPVQVDGSGNLNIYLQGDFEYWWLEGIVIPVTEKLSGLHRLSDPKITVYVSSRGGWTNVCWDIVELLERAKNMDVTVRTVVTSHAYSSGSMVAVVGSPGERYIGERATHLLHYGHSGAYWETPLQVEREAEWAKQHFGNVLAHYKYYTKVPRLDKLIEDDGLWFDAEDCIKYGIADKYTSELT